MGVEIPTRAREIVRGRQSGQCCRCGNTYTEIHHRMRRREGGHGVENLVGVCSSDHRWIHANPRAAREQGYIIPVSCEDIASVPLKSFMGDIRFTIDGDITFVSDN